MMIVQHMEHHSPIDAPHTTNGTHIDHIYGTSQSSKSIRSRIKSHFDMREAESHKNMCNIHGMASQAKLRYKPVRTTYQNLMNFANRHTSTRQRKGNKPCLLGNDLIDLAQCQMKEEPTTQQTQIDTNDHK